MSLVDNFEVELSRLNEEARFLPKFASLAEIPRYEKVITKINWCEFKELSLPLQWGMLYSASFEFDKIFCNSSHLLTSKNWDLNKIPIQYIRHISVLLQGLIQSPTAVGHLNWHLTLLYFDSNYPQNISNGILNLSKAEITQEIIKQASEQNWQMGCIINYKKSFQYEKYVLTFAHSSQRPLFESTPDVLILVPESRFEFN